MTKVRGKKGSSTDLTAPAPTVMIARRDWSRDSFAQPIRHPGTTLQKAVPIHCFSDLSNFGVGIIAGRAQVDNAVHVELARDLSIPAREAVLAVQTKNKLADAA